MTTVTELADRTNDHLEDIVGEQFQSWTDEDGDVCYSVLYGGVPVGLIIQGFGQDGALLSGFHVVGAKIEDEPAAARFVFRRNQELRIGRFELCGDGVIFAHQVFGTGVNKDTVRLLLGVLASESLSYADLAEATGALRPADLAALDNFDEV